MKKLWLLAAFAAFGFNYAGTASAAEYDYYQNTGVRQVSHNLGYGADCGCAVEPSCAAPLADTCCGDDACAGGCTSCCDSSCCGVDWLGDCCLGDPWTAFDNDNCHGITVGGWVQLGYHTEGANGNGTGLFNNYPNRVQAQQVWLYAEKATDTGGCGWDYGFRVDAMYGTDGPDTQAFGSQDNEWDNPWDYGSAYGAAIPQLYGTVAYNDLTVKIGHFYTIIGYEVVTAPDNFFYSHAFTMYNAEPFTHTGVLGEFAYNDHVTLWGGWTAGWDTGFTQNEGGSNFLGGFSAALTDDITLIYATTIGDFGPDSEQGYSHSIVVDVALSDQLNYVFQSDYVNDDDFVGGDGDIFGINQYLLYSFNDCLGIGGRFEYYDDPDFGGEIFATTVGLNYKPHANVIIRPEVRIDDYADNNGAFDSDGDEVADSDYRDSTEFGIDVILTY